jgi:hypothetical protein
VEAGRWAANVLGPDDRDALHRAARARASALKDRITAFSAGEAAEAVAICAGRETLAALALALRAAFGRTALDEALARVDAAADANLATLDDALAHMEEIPAILAHAPSGWWALH